MELVAVGVLTDITIPARCQTKALLQSLMDPLLSRGQKLWERVIHPTAAVAAALEVARNRSRPQEAQNHLFQWERML